MRGVALLSLALVACAPSRVETPNVAVAPKAAPLPTASSSSSPEPTKPSTSPLHVLGYGSFSSDKIDDPARLCGAKGALFVCGRPKVLRLVGDDLVHDVPLEAGLARLEDGSLHGRIHDVLGAFPDDPWIVMRTGVSIGTVALYRKRAADAAWKLAKKWKIESVVGDVSLVFWKPGHVVASVVSPVGDSFVQKVAVEDVADGAPALFPSVPPAPKKQDDCVQWLRSTRLVVLDDGAVALAGGRCGAEGAGWLKLVAGAKSAEKHDGDLPEPAANDDAKLRVEGAKLERRRPDGTYEAVPLPHPPVADATPLVPVDVRVLSDDDYVVAARSTAGKKRLFVVLRNKPTKNALAF